MKKFLRALALLAVLSLPLSVSAGAISAGGYALIDASSGRILKGQNADARFPMASTTKIMTGLLACESGKLDSVVSVSAEALKVEGSSMGLVAGEKITLREIVYGLLLESGNDAANAVAFYLDGSVSKFAERMNARASELSLKNTSFENPSGLDGAKHYTTASDLARLAAAAMQNPDFREISSTYSKRVSYNGIKDGRLLKNHNEMLKLYAGCTGVKTGYTKKSGRCLVTCAERGGLSLIAVTLKCHDDWNAHTELLNFGFENVKSRPLFNTPPELSVPVVSGDAECLACDYDKSLTAFLTKEEARRVKMRVCLPRFLYAPVSAGQIVGRVTFELDGAVIAETEIYARGSVNAEKPDKLKSLQKALFPWF